jgi:hypothetical protein
MTSESDQYWLGRWVDEYEVASTEDVVRLFGFPGPMARLVELASEAPTYRSPVQQVPNLSVAAGRGIDLSGYMSCGAYGCMRKQVNSCYGRIFHYFDYLVVEGLSPRTFIERLKILPKSRHDELQRELMDDVAILLYLRKIKASKYVLFRDKPKGFCSECMDGHAQKFGIPAYRDKAILDGAAERLAKEARIKMAWRKGEWSFWLDHEFFNEPALGRIKRAKKKPPTAVEAAAEVISDYSGGSLADVVFAEHLHTPLARAIEVSWLGDNGSAGPTAEDDVALNIDLPILNGINIGDLLSLREDEKPFFEEFRAALRQAIRSQIAMADTKSPQEIAQSVVREYIEPALADIDRRLRVNQRRLSRKMGAGLAVGTAATSAGLIGSLPLVVATGVAAIAASLSQFYKYVDDGTEIELSDMYFLWKVKKLSAPNH